MSTKGLSVASGGPNEVLCELYSLQKLQDDKDFSLEQPHAYLIGRIKKNKKALDKKVIKFKNSSLCYKSEVFKSIFGKYDIPYRDVKQYIIYDDFPRFTIIFLHIDNERFYAFFDCLNPIQSQKFCDLLRKKMKFEVSENSLQLGGTKSASTSRKASLMSESAVSEPKLPSLDAHHLKSILKTNTVMEVGTVTSPVEKKKKTEAVEEEKPEAKLVVEKKPETIVIVKSLSETDPSRMRPETKIYNSADRTQFDRDRVPLFVEEYDETGLKRVYYYSNKFLKENPSARPEKIPMRNEPHRFQESYDPSYFTFSRRGFSGNSFEFDEPEEMPVPRTQQPRHKELVTLSPRVQRSQTRVSYAGGSDYMPIRSEPFSYDLSRPASMIRNEPARQSRKSSTASSFSEFLNLDRVKNPYITHRNDI